MLTLLFSASNETLLQFLLGRPNTVYADSDNLLSSTKQLMLIAAIFINMCIKKCIAASWVYLSTNGNCSELPLSHPAFDSGPYWTMMYIHIHPVCCSMFIIM